MFRTVHNKHRKFSRARSIATQYEKKKEKWSKSILENRKSNGVDHQVGAFENMAAF